VRFQSSTSTSTTQTLHRALDDVATFEQSRLPCRGIEPGAEDDRVAFATVNVLDDRIREKVG
jgi:hypothetical protein